MYPFGADLKTAAFGIDQRVRRVFACFQRRRHRKRLQGRARFEFVGHGMIADLPGFYAFEIVRIKRGVIRQREYFAGTGVEHDYRARFRFIRQYRSAQFVIRQILQPHVYRQHQILSGPGA